MNEAVRQYAPLVIADRLCRQATNVWLAATTASLAWVLLIIGAPLARVNGFTAISIPLYSLFSYMCHQISERSFHLEGEQFGVCSRCFGVYLGLFAGFVIYPIWRHLQDIEPIPRIWLFLSLVPIGIDWSLGVFGIWENTHLSRLLTGMILGVACATFIMPALVEIARNLTLNRQRKKAA
jgi:uncharacterized membrane protein